MNGLSGLEHKGLVHLYTGSGKGKTTAAAGLAARALGAGKTVLFCQFLKGGESGEVDSLERLGARILRAKRGLKFTFQMNDAEHEQLTRDHALCFREICGRVLADEADVVVLDEAVDAVNLGLIPEDGLLSLISGRPAGVELVLTGRKPSAAICGAADYHTDFVCVRHPYDHGVPARKGIEY